MTPRETAQARVTAIRLALANAYWVHGPQGAILVDAGSPWVGPALCRRLERLGGQLRLILVTHAHLDHYGGAAAVREATGAPIAIHPDDAAALAEGRTPIPLARGPARLLKLLLSAVEPILPTPSITPNLLLEDGEDLGSYLGLEARVVHTPGHTPGSACLLVEGRHALVGDLISATGHPHRQRYFACDWGQIDASVLKLASLSPQALWPGHGAPPLEGAALRRLLH